MRRDRDMAPIINQRILDGMLTDYAWEKIENNLDIAELICPLCKKYLIHKDDFYHCYWCGLTTEVVLVVDRLVADADPQRLSIRLLQREGTLTPEAWQHAEANKGFLIGFLVCPSCEDPITHLSEDATGEKPSCCQVSFLPEIKDIPYSKPPRRNRIQRWKVSYEVENAEIPYPTPCELKLIDLGTYQSELERFAPKIETFPIVADPPPSEPVEAPPPEDLPSSDDTEVSIPETIDVTHTDAINWFLRKFILGKPTAITPRNDVYEAYVHWIRKHRQEPLSNKIFYRHLREIFPYVRSGQNRINGKMTRCYRGISLRRDADLLSG